MSNLDAKLRVEMRTEMKLMHQRLKTTTVYVTHDQTGDDPGRQVAVMKDASSSKVFARRKRFYNDPVNLFVAVSSVRRR